MSSLAPSSVIADVEGFPREWLQGGFNADIAAHFGQPAPHCVTDLIVPDGRKTAFGTGERVFHREVGPAGTVGGSIGGEPAISGPGHL